MSSKKGRGPSRTHKQQEARPLTAVCAVSVWFAEMIRNAGGRVTPDVVRSLVVAQVGGRSECRRQRRGVRREQQVQETSDANAATGAGTRAHPSGPAFCCPPFNPSQTILQEVPELSTREVMIIHHTDCGAQAAMRHHNHLVARMKELLAQWNVLGWAVQVRVQAAATSAAADVHCLLSLGLQSVLHLAASWFQLPAICALLRVTRRHLSIYEHL